MANDKDHGYKKASLKVKTDRVFTVKEQRLDGDTVKLTVEVSDYNKPDKITHNLTVDVPLNEFKVNSEDEMLKRLDFILEQYARRLVATERVINLVGHQKRWATSE